MKQYLDAVQQILDRGTRKENRTSVDTLSAFGIHYNIDLRNGFPLLTTKKISWKNIVVENLWFLSGEPSIELLQKHGCKFWDAWADENGRVPSAYGNFWRRFPVHGDICADWQSAVEIKFSDQIAWVIDELKRNPMSRRLVVSAWAPDNAQTSKLPPCHVMFVLNVQNLPSKEYVETDDGKYCGVDACAEWVPLEQGCCIKHGGEPKTEPHLCLHLTQRSCDIALGVPYNIAGYGFLLELFARFSSLPAGIFSHTLIDAHAYTCKPDGSMADMDHVPGLREQLTRMPRELPRLKIAPMICRLDDIRQVITSYDTEALMSLFKLEDYNPHPAIRFRVAV